MLRLASAASRVFRQNVVRSPVIIHERDGIGNSFNQHVSIHTSVGGDFEHKRHGAEQHEWHHLRGKFSDHIIEAVGWGAAVAVGYRLTHSNKEENVIERKSKNLWCLWQTINSFDGTVKAVIGDKNQAQRKNDVSVSSHAPSFHIDSSGSLTSTESWFDGSFAEVSDSSSYSKDPFSKSASGSGRTSDDSGQFTAHQKEAAEALDRALRDFKDLCVNHVAKDENIKGLKRVKKGDIERAVKHWEIAADLGYSKAQFNLGICYERGRGVKCNLSKALSLYKAAADQEHLEAMYNLAVLYIRGEKPDEVEKGLEILQKAAHLGLVEAQAFLGIHYIVKDGFNIQQALPLLEAAAKHKHPEALYYLGQCYEDGWGGEIDQCRAAEYYSKASRRGHTDAMISLGTFFEKGIGGLPENVSSAKDLYQKAFSLGNERGKTKWNRLLAIEALETYPDSIHPSISKSQSLVDFQTYENNAKNQTTHLDIDLFGSRKSLHGSNRSLQFIEFDYKRQPFYRNPQNKSLSNVFGIG